MAAWSTSFSRNAARRPRAIDQLTRFVLDASAVLADIFDEPTASLQRCPALTAGRAWAALDIGVEIVCIR